MLGLQKARFCPLTLSTRAQICGVPKGTRFNQTKSGWFDASTFDDWFRTVVVLWARRLKGRKLVIGDNLSSHLNLDIVKLCSKNNIIMAFLPANTTHLTQPLDVAYFRGLKGRWRKILTDYKIAHPYNAGLSKGDFQSLLNKVMKASDLKGGKNLQAEFEAAVIVPFNPQKVLEKMPTRNNQPEAIAENANASVFDFLEKSRMPQEKGPSKHCKKVTVVPGALISEEHFFVEQTLETITKHKKSGIKSKRKICSKEESKAGNADSIENEEKVEIDDDFEESKSEDKSQEEIKTEEKALDDSKHGAKDEHKRGERYTECDTNDCSSL